MKKSDKASRWHHQFLELCDHVSTWSEDQDFQVGAVIVGPDLEVRSTGYNGFPRGVKSDDPGRLNRKTGEKFFWVEHAERNAIFNAARIGTPLGGCNIYINRYPCSDCARAIIQSGIKTIYCPPKPTLDGALDHSFNVAEVMISESDVAIRTSEDMD